MFEELQNLLAIPASTLSWLEEARMAYLLQIVGNECLES